MSAADFFAATGWLQRVVRRLAGPVSCLVAIYTTLVALFTLARFLRLSGFWLVDLANAFAPYWYMPLALTLPLSIIAARQGAAPPPARKQPATGARKAKDQARARQWRRRDRWSALLQIALILVGLVCFAWPGRYQAIDPPQGETFSLATFNVQGSNAELEAASEWLLASGADIIVLQETADGYDQRLERLYDVYAHEEHIAGSVRVFSRYAILERQILPIEDEPGRLALRLVLDQDGRQLAIYAVHLTLPQADSAGAKGHFGFDLLLRYNEARRNAQLRRLLDIMRGERIATLVAGDFNMSDSSLVYDEIAAQLHDAWRGAGTGAGRSWPVAEAIGLPRILQPFLRIDYIWHSERLRTVSAGIGPAIGSDHLPLLAAFEWQGDA